MDEEIAAIEAWLAEDKTLVGVFPGWGRAYGRDYTSRWGIADSIGVQRAELAITCDRRLLKPTICVIMERRLVFRLDIVPEGETEPNPMDAMKFGLPGLVTGSHTHPWVHNREWIRMNGFGELPYREPAPRVRTLEQGLAATADAVNLTLTSDQRDCRLPEEPGLF
jgi:hypothetical protein